MFSINLFLIKLQNINIIYYSGDLRHYHTPSLPLYPLSSPLAYNLSNRTFTAPPNYKRYKVCGTKLKISNDIKVTSAVDDVILIGGMYPRVDLRRYKLEDILAEDMTPPAPAVTRSRRVHLGVASGSGNREPAASSSSEDDISLSHFVGV